MARLAPAPLRGAVYGAGGGLRAFQSAGEFLSIIEMLPPFAKVQLEGARPPQAAHEVLTSLVANLDREPCVYLLSDTDFTREVSLLEALEDAKTYKSNSRAVVAWDLGRTVYDRYGEEQVLADCLAAYLDAASDAAMQVFLKEIRQQRSYALSARGDSCTLDREASTGSAIRGAPHSPSKEGAPRSSHPVLDRIFKLGSVEAVEAEEHEKILAREDLIAKALQDVLEADQTLRAKAGSDAQVVALRLRGRLRSGGYEYEPERIVGMCSLLRTRSRGRWVSLPPFLNVERIELAKRRVERSKKRCNDGERVGFESGGSRPKPPTPPGPAPAVRVT